eukprot:scaffold8351_cov93-Skeletonema_dohrnii-CCMP3373.AAC.6
MPKLCCCVDCGKIAAAAVAVNTSVGVGDSGPPTAPFESANSMQQISKHKKNNIHRTGENAKRNLRPSHKATDQPLCIVTHLRLT